MFYLHFIINNQTGNLKQLRTQGYASLKRCRIINLQSNGIINDGKPNNTPLFYEIFDAAYCQN